MYPLIKQDLFINSMWSYIIILVMIALAYITMFPPIFFFFVIILSLLITLYYYDNKNNVISFLISLPIAKNKIVQSRYMSIACLTVVLLFYQWFIMIVFASDSHYLYDWQDIITVFGITLIMLAIFIPIYHIVRSPHIATGITLILFLIGVVTTLNHLVNILGMEDFISFNDMDAGFSLLVEKYIPFLPYLIFLLLSLTIFYLSMKLSQKIFSSKDQ